MEYYIYDEQGEVFLEKRYRYNEDGSHTESKYSDGVLYRTTLCPSGDRYPRIEWNYDEAERLYRVEYWGVGDWDTNFGVLDINPETGIITLVSGIDLEGNALADRYQEGTLYEEVPAWKIL